MILAALKVHTREQHERVEAALPLLRPDLTGAQYRRLLERFWGYYHPVEARLAALRGWGAWGIDPAERAKLPLLERDLRALGLAQSALDGLPRCAALPALAALPQALGCMYVLEGATLGGAVIARHLRPRWTPEHGAAFFASYGPEVGTRWKRFGAALTAYAAARPDDEAAILHAAHATFATLGSWLLATD